MTKAKDKADSADDAAASGFRIFTVPGTAKERIALNLETGATIATDGPGKYFVTLGGVRHHIVSEESLEELAGLPVEDVKA